MGRSALHNHDSSEKEIFYRLFGVFADGGTMANGQMIDVEEVPNTVAYWLKKNPNLVNISIIKVER